MACLEMFSGLPFTLAKESADQLSPPSAPPPSPHRYRERRRAAARYAHIAVCLLICKIPVMLSLSRPKPPRSRLTPWRRCGRLCATSYPIVNGCFLTKAIIDILQRFPVRSLRRRPPSPLPSEKPVALVNDDEFENMVLAAMHTTMNSAAIKALTAMVATDGVEIERAAVSAINFAKEIIASASPHPGEANSSDGGKIDHGDNCPCPLCKSLRPSETNPQPVAWTDEAYTKARDCMVDILRKRSWCITERGVGEFDEAFQHAVGLLSLNATPPSPCVEQGGDCADYFRRGVWQEKLGQRLLL
jgi:hypothetical protein